MGAAEEIKVAYLLIEQPPTATQSSHSRHGDVLSACCGNATARPIKAIRRIARSKPSVEQPQDARLRKGEALVTSVKQTLSKGY